MWNRLKKALVSRQPRPVGHAHTPYRPQLEALEDRMLLSATVVEVESNNKKSQATVFTLTSDDPAPTDDSIQLQGISSKKDKDYFAFTANANESVRITVNEVDGVFARLWVEDQNGNGSFVTHPKQGINSGLIELESGITYYLRFRSETKAAAGYTADLLFGALSAEPPPSSMVTETEINDFKGSADVFGFDAVTGTAQLLGTASGKKDKDYFVFTAQQDGTVDLTVTSTNGVMAKLQVQDNAENEHLSTDPNLGINSGSFAVTAGMTYFLRLRSPGGPDAGYQVDLTFTAPAPVVV